VSATAKGATAAGAAAALLILSGCGQGAADASGKLQVVAAENVWGSIAQQLGGDRVEVTSIITNPASDPHDYEPTSADARAMAGARLAIVNGIGYDTWASRLLAANPTPGRVTLDVGDLLGLAAGDNPHQWYSPAAVRRMVRAISADYRKLEPGHSAYFAHRRAAFETNALARYRRLVARIRRRYAGTPVGASESVFAPLASALGLRLLTPTSFLDAISEGAEPTPADKATVDRQIATRRIAVWVYNPQNATPDIQRLNDAARRAGIPVATVTETLVPAGASFESWQVRELEALRAALAKAAAR
jgi:zinc/manganese transport system substrate-binding protein